MTTSEVHLPFLIIFSIMLPGVIIILGLRRIAKEDLISSSILGGFLVTMPIVSTWIKGSTSPLNVLMFHEQAGMVDTISVSVGYALFIRALLILILRR